MEYRNDMRDRRVASAVTISKKALAMLLVLTVILSTALSMGLSMWLFGGQGSLPGSSSGQSQQAAEQSGSSGNSGALTGQAVSYNNVISDIQDTVVSITTESIATDMWARNYVTQGAGSGVIISQDGYILTCNHVIEGATRISVALNDKTEYEAVLVGADPSNDLAVLKIQATGLKAARYGDSSKLKVGDQVIAIGNPLGTLSGTVTTGIISCLNRDLTIDGKTLNLLQTDASINPGNSGGALFDSNGNLIGIVVAKSTGSDVEGLGFAIPINRGKQVAAALMDDGSQTASNEEQGTQQDQRPANQTPMIGVSLAIVSDDQAPYYGLSRGGLYITGLLSEEAEKGGLEEGDRIISVDGTTVTGYDHLQSILKNYQVGDSVTILVDRDGSTVKCEVTLT